MPSYSVTFSEHAIDAQHPDEDNYYQEEYEWCDMKIRTTKKGLFDYLLPYQCGNECEHTYTVDDYTTGGCLDYSGPNVLMAIATAIMTDEMQDDLYYAAGGGAIPDSYDDIYPVENGPESVTPEGTEATYQYRRLKENYGPNVVRYVEKLHKNLGHPKAETLVRMIQAANGRQEVIDCAREFHCVTCLARRRKN